MRYSSVRLERLPSSAGISQLKSLSMRARSVRLERLAQLRRYLPAQGVAAEVHPYNAPVVVGADALPFAEGSVAQPFFVARPVLTVRCVVEGNQGFPVRFGGAGAAGGAVAVAGSGASVAVGAAPDPGVVGVRAGEAGVSVGVDAVRSGPVTPDGSSEPQAASAAVRASARIKLNRVMYLVVRVRVIFFPSRFYWRHSQQAL